jgi:hypothetical protein
MTDQGSDWIVEPPGADAAVIRIDVDHETVTPELREALEALSRAMEAMNDPEEVEAYRRRPCPNNVTCDPLTSGPCVAKTIIDCTIYPCPSKTRLEFG